MESAAATPHPAGTPVPLADAMWASASRFLEMERVLLTAHEARVGATPKELLWRKNKARLYRYVRDTPATRQTPVLLVMPLINRAYILDLRPGSSLVAFLLQQGFEVFLLDWGVPGDEDGHLDLDAYLSRYLLRALRKTSAAAGAGERPVTILGYCIGGVLAACFAALYPEEPIRNLVLFTTPIDFSGAGHFGLWTAEGAFPIDKLVDTFPIVPAQVPEFGSRMLTPLPSTMGVYLRLYAKLQDPAFDVRGWQAMYRWVNDGVPFPGAAYRQWIKEFYQGNKLVRGTLRMDGRPVLLSNIRCPLLNVVASVDTIAPRGSTAATLQHVGSTDKEELVVHGGHVGIVVGRAAHQNLWPGVAAWLERHD